VPNAQEGEENMAGEASTQQNDRQHRLPKNEYVDILFMFLMFYLKRNQIGQPQPLTH
jgi:hypothetical protein